MGRDLIEKLNFYCKRLTECLQIAKSGINRVGTNFWLKIGNFFLGNLFQILKKPLDVKKSPDSKSAIFMSVSRPEVHEF